MISFVYFYHAFISDDDDKDKRSKTGLLTSCKLGEDGRLKFKLLVVVGVARAVVVLSIPAVLYPARLARCKELALSRVFLSLFLCSFPSHPIPCTHSLSPATSLSPLPLSAETNQSSTNTHFYLSLTHTYIYTHSYHPSPLIFSGTIDDEKIK